MSGYCKRLLVGMTAGALALTQTWSAVAMPVGPSPDAGPGVTQTRGGFHGGGGHWHGGGGWHGGHGGWHGGHHGGYHDGYHGGYRGRPVYVGGWRRPYYGWAPGGAIAAGAAIGVLGAAAAAAYASSSAPAAGLCWYYTDASRRSGFWDKCP